MKRALAAAALILLPLICLAYDMPAEQEIAADPTILFACFDHKFSQIDDYTSTFLKMEVLDGKVYPEETIRVSFAKPDMIKLEWISEPNKGMWAVYNSEKDKEHFWARDVSWRSIIGVHKYALDSKFTNFFHPNRFIITDSDFKSLVDIIKHFCVLSKSLGTLEVEYRGRVTAPGTDTEAFFIHAFLYPEPDPRFMAREADVYLDTQNCMPVNVTLYGWDDSVIGRYVERDIRFDVGLNQNDFAITE